MGNTVFSKKLRKLREDKHISQKSAAASLGISQALLSHYEKGIRECGLDFLIRAAGFYEVSADFLLGITDKNDKKDKPDINKTKNSDCQYQKNGVEFNIYAALYKNLLTNALTYIFDDMKDIKHKDISVLCGKYISMSIYCIYTMLYSGDVPIGKYNFDNPYLNNIINGVNL
jgi:transcriptional regulator with XRE-family HTH domain